MSLILCGLTLRNKNNFKKIYFPNKYFFRTYISSKLYCIIIISYESSNIDELFNVDSLNFISICKSFKFIAINMLSITETVKIDFGNQVHVNTNGTNPIVSSRISQHRHSVSPLIN